MATPSSSLANLKSEWHTLNDLDRGRAVFAIKQDGTRIRELARKLNCSDSLLRRLLKAIEAPIEDCLLARQLKISTSELVRRARAARTRRTDKQHEAREFERAKDSIRGSKTICDWLTQERMSGAYGEQIVCEAQRDLAIAERTNQLPKDAAPADLSVAQIIRKFRPPVPTTDANNFVAWFACWLARWAFFAFTDSDVRYRALELALDTQFKR